MEWSIDFDLASSRARFWSGTVSIDFKGKALQLVATLISTPDDQFVWRAAIHRLPGWGQMELDSVGKQIARMMGGWAALGVEPIECYKKTDGWRLKSEVRAVLTSETIAQAASYLDDLSRQNWKRLPKVTHSDLAYWACQNVNAMLAMTEGQAELAYEELKPAYTSSTDPVLTQIANVLATRIGQRFPDPHLPVLPGAHLRAAGLDLAFAARRMAAYAIRTQSDNWKTVTDELEQVLTQLLPQSDFTSQAIVMNALALLHRRLGNFDAALEFAREAMPLAVFSGDIILTQNVMFNLGNILSECNRQAPLPEGPDMFLRLLEMDIGIRNRLGVGRDSAQTDLLLAFLNYESGNLHAASEHLVQAEAIIELNRSRTDSALAKRIKGLILLTLAKAHGGSMTEGETLMLNAVEEYIAIGNVPAAEYVRKELDTRKNL